MGLADKVLEGNVQAAARLITGIEDELPGAIQELDILYPHTGRAHIVGITGAPGIGKSTLVDCLIGVFRKRDMTVGVIAVDPTSPFTGGAILGDRIRMQHYGTDKDVFIRSLATRGWSGGLAKAAISTVHVMDAMGKDVILIETVGTGQGEVEIARVADTCLVVLSPGTGDEIQVIKAGIMEIADIFVINKADKPGAENIAMEIEMMLGMKTCPHPSEADWKPGVVLTEAISGRGAEELVEQISKHREFLVCGGGLERRREERAKQELMGAIESFVRSYFHQEIERGGEMEKLIADFVRRKESPHSAAMKIIRQFTSQFRPVTS
ncbi:MAG: methylmalonyl Co-A mutase-associated GTPase MeaB [Chloroflexi bacterium]|nr:methylmalonyl Co-A mutase-associated GTPase MeaB [Chloroflexota bacterium]